MPRCRTKIFGRDSKEQTTQRISSRKRISTSGLRDLTITVHGSRWCGSNLVAQVMGKVRGPRRPRGHGENQGHSRHHARQGTHDDRKNNVAHSSDSALATHVLQKGVAHGARKYTD
jgi:hypothetical protein